MRRFSFWHALYLSFFSKEFYQDVGRRWPGVGLAYLFFLLVLAWLPLMVKLHLGMQSFARDHAPKIIQQLPRITITKGVVETDPPGRHEIKDPDGKTFLIIDPSIETLNLDELPSVVALLTRTKLVIKQTNQRQTRVQDLSSIQSFSMDRSDAQRWAQALGRWMAVAVFPFALLFSYVYRICQLLFYALIGLALARGAATYPVVMRLTAVAVTPAVLVDTLKDLIPLPVPLWWLICFLIAMFYLDFALRAMREPEPESAAQAPPPIAG